MADQLAVELAQPEGVGERGAQRADLLDTAQHRLDRVAQRDRPALVWQPLDHEPGPRAQRVGHAVLEQHLTGGQLSVAPQSEFDLAAGAGGDPVRQQLARGADPHPGCRDEQRDQQGQPDDEHGHAQQVTLVEYHGADRGRHTGGEQAAPSRGQSRQGAQHLAYRRTWPLAWPWGTATRLSTARTTSVAERRAACASVVSTSR